MNSMFMIGLIIGLIFGFGVTTLLNHKKIVGTIKIDVTDPEVDRYLLEVDAPLETLSKQSLVSFKIDTSYIS